MKRLFLVLAALSPGACHIISGGDEIVVADEDEEDGSSGSGSPTGSNVTVGGGPCTANNIDYAAGDPQCALCLGDECCPQVTACDTSTECVLFVDCLANCFECDCVFDFPAGAAIADGIATCGAAYCASECGGGF